MNSQKETFPIWQSAVPATLVAAGVLLLIWSFIAPRAFRGPSGWSQEQAKQYQAVSAKLHALSNEYSVQATEQKSPDLRRELEATYVEYAALRAELENAIHRPRYVIWLMRIGGLLLTAGGVLLLLRAPAAR